MSHIAANVFLKKEKKKWDVIFIKSTILQKEEIEITFNVRDNARSYFQLIFDDIDCQFPPYLLPTLAEIKAALMFAEDKTNVLVSCNNGLTSAPAIAYLIRCTFLNPDEAIEIFSKFHHPNKYIINLGSDILKNSDIVTVFNDWKTPLKFKD